MSLGPPPVAGIAPTAGTSLLPIIIMSIAVSAVVNPSRRLRWLLAAFGAALCAVAVAVGLLLPERFAGGALVALAPLFAALLLGHSCMFLPAAATAHRIDISGVGQLRVTVQQDMSGNGAAALLLPGATVWPCCMVLRLRVDTGAVRTLVLLPDSVGCGQYRALAVAVRSLAAGAAAGLGPAADGGHKIL
ncbi:protein YgfX [Massilia sp. YIM B02443]|uniref:protein YgfX n=1 Tax=Massilia sp. YIM B02443 TaxID=3050127 RepID=UPI0025B64292|nr:protein YgfX [Massilia sp. YIM B02443]MDN4038506.1 hypothetical protein [Massilia sp. YIM B02443]